MDTVGSLFALGLGHGSRGPFYFGHRGGGSEKRGGHAGGPGGIEGRGAGIIAEIGREKGAAGDGEGEEGGLVDVVCAAEGGQLEGGHVDAARGAVGPRTQSPSPVVTRQEGT